jgi:NAD+ kinase
VKGDTIGVLVHPRRDSHSLIEIIVEWAAGHGKTVRGMNEARNVLPATVTTVADELLAEGASLVIAAGGDGTILRGLKLAHPHQVPVLGVNLGRLAFLAEVQYDDLATSLDAIDRDDYWLEARATMEVTGSVDALPLTAFNDAAITRVPGHGPAALAVEVEGEVFARYTADALVIATPTGSTGYSFSAGGPILDPSARNLIVTPIAAYLSAIRSVVVGPSQVVRCTVVDAFEALVSIDGREDLPLAVGDVVEVHASERPIRLIEPLGAQPFWDLLRRKVALLPS